MSDNFRNQPEMNSHYGRQNAQKDGWERSAYPSVNGEYPGGRQMPEGEYGDMSAGHGGEDPYSAWRRPEGNNFLDAEPTPLGAEMQQGGVPLYHMQQREDDFAALGSDAPTKLAPAVQRVSRRTTVAEGVMTPPGSLKATSNPVAPVEVPSVLPEEQPRPAEIPAGAAVRRRRSRINRPRADESVEIIRPNTQAAFDPFSAGDSEINEAAAAGHVDEGARRAAVPGGRYTGARTAIPSGGVAEKAQAARDELRQRQADIRDENPLTQSGYTEEKQPGTRQATTPGEAPGRRIMPPRRGMAQPYGDEGVRPSPRTAAPQESEPPRRGTASQGYAMETMRPGQRQPMPSGSENHRPMAESAKRPPQAGNGPYGRGQIQDSTGYRSQQPRSPYDEESQSQRAPVKRKPYDFEAEEETPPQRKGGALVAVIIVLLVLGGLLAGICLPDWAHMGGAVGQTILPVKNAVVTTFNSVKNMILPEEDLIKSFTVSPSGATAPVTVRLMVQTSKNIAGLRVADDQGNTLYSAAYSDQLSLTNEVVANSNFLIWQPTCTIEQEYNGGFTAYATKKDGTESEGFPAGNSVAIAAPKPALPPVQSFTIDTESAAVPVDVIFAVVTSTDVSAVRVVDQYKSPVGTMTVDDMDGENGTMMEYGDVRTWTLNTEISAAYSGSYTVQYRTEDDALNYTDSDYSVSAQFTTEEEPANDDHGDLQAANVDALGGDETLTDIPDEVDNPTPATAAPTARPTQAPTQAPTPEPTPAPTLAPDSTPLPVLNAQAGESASPSSDELKLKAVLYSNGKGVETITRTSAISLLSPFTTYAGGSDYAIWKQAGVLTFRSGPFRQNAAYGTVEVENEKLTQVWSQPIGSMKVSNDTLHGVNAPGQPVIVKWPTEVRQRMGILTEAKEITALKEAIIAGQDGKVYFLNLLDGTATRDPIDLGAPSAGGLSVATNGTPILGVGQSHSKLSGKTVKSGYHLINLLKNKEEMLVQTDGKERNSNYSGVLGAALFDSKTGAMIFGSQGGVLYTAELGKQTEAYDYQIGKLTLSSALQGYKATVKGQDKKNTNIDASVAMYNNYVYYGDQMGIVQCVNVNDLTTVWAVNTGDNVDATPALDMDDESTVSLYTGTTLLLKRKEGKCVLRRLNALTGAEDWSYEVPDITYDNEYDIGLEASPVVGQENISDLVVFTVTNGKKGSKTLALNKQTGNVEWQTDFSVETVSSPVAVYNEAGDAWIIQALEDGQINLMDGRTGEVKDMLKLDAKIKASPAVYGNLMVIGTTGNNKGGVYCIKID